MPDETLPPLALEAIAAIGEDNDRHDWIMEPERHVEMLADAPKTGPLVRILQRESVAKIIKAYRTADAKAIKDQKRYRRLGRLGIFATLAATLIGALYIFPFHGWLEIPQIKGVALALQFSALALAFLATWWLRSSEYFENWMHHRGEAEIQRIALFDEVISADEPARNGELPVLPLQLEYFRRFQLNMQRRYYKGRGEEHARGAMRFRGWRIFSWVMRGVVALIAIPAFIVLLNQTGWIDLSGPVAVIKAIPVLGVVAGWAEKSLLAIGVIASAIHAAAEARTRMDLDERNAARYQTTFDNLKYLTETGLAHARICAARGEKANVVQFVNAIQRQISSEHQEWVRLQDVAPNPVAG